MMVNYQTDKYPLTSLYFYLTQGCNLKCRHCWINPKYQDLSKEVLGISVPNFSACIDQALPLGLESVKLTGGEPFLHPQIDKLLDIIHEKELGLVIESNGCLITPELTHKIKKCKDPFISISIDSTDIETHEWFRGVKGCFATAVRGMKYCIKENLPTQIIMSLVKQNRDHIDDMIQFATDTGCESVKFNIVQPTERGKNIYNNNEHLTIEDYINIGRYITDKAQPKTKLRLDYGLPPAFLPLSYMLSGHKHGCSSGCAIKNILGVLWNGDISICGIGENVEELILGDIDSSELGKIWENNKVIDNIRKGLPEKVEGICKKCIFKMICFGYCPANNYYGAKSLFAPGWFCDKANTEGLFPGTRLKSKKE
ncbi:MAG: SynChlorMet cassette radical SAM/SPASM protein ScmF [Desulfobacteraceae bacterium]|nr:SynChlorMet cassette radical SAM/SPASM protein ScmF [Desulfobacteraceae bacterium]